ncbi:ribbon-helix-helix domain-containing protein [Azospirillum sp. HJ39]|uniref:ribbon-helix-helix domain-containing protein n=1 Tax=Azospirillum sp. HJ39 TaxID=3159496 RepID=UPI003558E4B2
MCRIFVNTDPILYEARSRSVRIHGMVTSIRLENLFWTVLSDIAAEQGTTTNRLIVTLHDEVVEAHGAVQNLASFLRVSCARYLSMTAGEPLPDEVRTKAGSTGEAMTGGASVIALWRDRSPSDRA